MFGIFLFLACVFSVLFRVDYKLILSLLFVLAFLWYILIVFMITVGIF